MFSEKCVFVLWCLCSENYNYLCRPWLQWQFRQTTIEVKCMKEIHDIGCFYIWSYSKISEKLEGTRSMFRGVWCVWNLFALGPPAKFRHRKKFWAFTGPRRDFGLILLILNMIIHRSFTGPTHLLSANVWGPVSLAVSANFQSSMSTCISIPNLVSLSIYKILLQDVISDTEMGFTADKLQLSVPLYKKPYIIFIIITFLENNTESSVYYHEKIIILESQIS